MPFCTQCGNQIKEGADFCSNCGKKSSESVDKKSKTDSFFQKIKNTVLKAIDFLKHWFLNYSIDYNSPLFKIGVIVFSAIGVGEGLFNIFWNYLRINLFPYSYYVFELAFWIIMAIGALLMFGKWHIQKPKKQFVFLQVVWISALLLQIFIFLISSKLHSIIMWTFELQYGSIVLLAISTLLLLFFSRPKNPLFLFISLLIFQLNDYILPYTKANISLINLYKTIGKMSGELNVEKIAESYMKIFRVDSGGLGLITLVAVAFLLRFLLPKKASTWAVVIAAVTIFGVNVASVISESFSMELLIGQIIDVISVLCVVFLCLACNRTPSNDAMIDEQPKNKTKAIKSGVVSLVSAAGFLAVLIFISSIVCSAHINANLKSWKEELTTLPVKEDSWSIIRGQINKYRANVFASMFISDYSSYKTIKDNINDLEIISKCYSAYQSNSTIDTMANSFKYIEINSYWESNDILNPYYQMYNVLLPKENKILAQTVYSVHDKEITITVTNKNIIPLSSCKIRVDFDFYYLDNDYDLRRDSGTEYFTVYDIKAKGTTEVTFGLDLKDYVDSIWGYSGVWSYNNTIKLESIEL